MRTPLTFESVTNLIVILVGGLVLLASLRYGNVSSREHARQAPSSYTEGESLSLPVDHANGSKTLVLAVRSTCDFCTQSMPFYHRLLQTPAVRGGKVRVLVI